MDNTVFNVNGSGDKFLLATLELAFSQTGRMATGWKVTEKGLVLYWAEAKDVTPFPFVKNGLSAEAVMPTVKAWLASEEAAQIKLADWDRDLQHDGDNSKGWRVFTEGWGHIDSEWQAFLAITPAYMWHGK